MRRLLALIALSFASRAGATFPITYVEAYSTVDCAVTYAGHLATFGGGAGAGTHDFDADGRVEGAAQGGTTENTDPDQIFDTVALALSNTSPGGIVYVLPGIYHEKVTISDSVTIRGIDRDTVIFDATCLGANGKAFEVTGTGKTVTIENMTIIGYTHGVYADDSTLNVTNCAIEASTAYGIYSDITLNVDRCRLRANDTGIWMPGSSYRAYVTNTEILRSANEGIMGDDGAWYISGCTIKGNETGILMSTSGGTNILMVDDCKLLDNTNEGVKYDTVSSSCQFSVQRSQVVGNGGDGISYTGRNSGTVRIADSVVEANGDDGIIVVNNAGCVSAGTATLRGLVRNCRIFGNVGDGIETSGSGSCSLPQISSSSTISVMGNTIAYNGGYALRTTTSGANNCSLGHNQLSNNVLGVENSGSPQCANSGTSVNQVP